MKSQSLSRPTSWVFGRSNSLLLVVASLLLLMPFSASVHAQNCSVEDISTVSCGVNSDPGVVRSLSNENRHVGNPVDVLTGAKQQQELDYQAVGSPLHLSRYYHTALVDENVSMGQGWRHSYMVKHYLVDDKHRRIQQADGRWINFTLSDESEEEEVYYPENEGDGYLVDDGDIKWELPDGRVLIFNGSYLTNVQYPHGINLQLAYKNKRLVSVTDTHGRSLEIEYIVGRAGLAKFEDTQSGELKGHINAVQLPSGERITYQYDVDRNLISAQMEENQRSEYEYLDARFPNHLTSVGWIENNEIIERTWTYRDDGRVVEHNDFYENRSISIDYELHNEGGSSLVTFNNGHEERYDWVNGETGAQVEVVSYRSCSDCEWKTRKKKEPIEKEKNVRQEKNKQRGEDESEDGSLEEINERVYTPYSYPTLEQLKPSSNSDEMITDLVINGVSHTFYIKTTRYGKVENISVGSMSKSSLAAKLAEGKLERCGIEGLFTRHLINPFPEKGCIEDLLYLVDLSGHIERITNHQGLKPSSSWDRRGNFTRPNHSYGCTLDSSPTCTTARRKIQLAELSKCAYEDLVKTCGDGWQAVDPSTINLDERLFVNGAFSSTLFFNSKSQEYVVAYRGTDEVVDWLSNINQAGGIADWQYLKAVKLAKMLEDALPSSKLTFTGHSLGGGLATAAALAVQKSATVFNPAGLNKFTARKLGINYSLAKLLVSVTAFEGDALTKIQMDLSILPTAPGKYTFLEPPAAEWIEQKKNELPIASRGIGSILHTMDAVLEAGKNLIEELC